MTTSSVPAIKSYLFGTVLPTVYAGVTGVQILYGPAGSHLDDDVVMVGDVRTSPEVTVMSPTRPYDERIDVTVVISCTRRGPDSATQQTATEQAFNLLSLFRDYFKTRGNEILGGACRESRVTSYDLVESADPEVISNGRNAAITVTLSCIARN